MRINFNPKDNVCNYQITIIDTTDPNNRTQTCGKNLAELNGKKTEFCEYLILNYKMTSFLILKFSRDHLKLNLNYQIADEKLNPISLCENIEKLKRIIRRNKKEIPNISNKSEIESRNILIQVCFISF